MQIRINGSANLSQVRAEFAALQAQVTGLNAAMAKGATPAVNPAGYQKYTNAVQAGSKAFRDSLASTGAFRVEQMKLNSATEHYTELLQKQKLSFRDMRRNSDVMKSIYKEQLMMDKLRVRHAGGNFWDVYRPTSLSDELGTLNQKLAFTGAKLKSAGTHMVNFGKNTQWAGRQLTVGLTMPVVALGAASAVMAYKVDQQMTRVRKVYDTTADQSSTNVHEMMAVQAEFAQLNKDSWETVETATRKYAAAASDTLSVQAELAATGITGARLQKSTVEVMKSAMLGEIDYNTATSATIALQQQLHLSNMELADSWAYMNSVENSTSLQMKDFAAAIPIALGPIRQMGGDLQDLGTLMTAMISRGVQVGKAANAIKSMPQRLSRPSKQVQQEYKALTGQDIVEQNKNNQGNIIGLLTDIEHSVENLSEFNRRKVLAGLFGSYQLSTMTAMIDGMKDLENQTGQTYKAFQIGEQNTKDWRQVSEQEIKQMQESVSFRFKKMINEVKNASVEFGRPFLEVGIVVGKAIADVMDGFNSLPKAVKILAAVGLAIGALAGPGLMLTGLFANLFGSGVKAAGGILSMGKAMVITTAQERAMIKAHEAEAAAMASSERVIANRTMALEMLAAAETQAEKAMMGFMLLNAGHDPALIAEKLELEAAAVKSVAAALREEAAAAKQVAANLRGQRDVAFGAGNTAAGQALAARAEKKSNEARSLSARANAAAAKEEAAAKAKTAQSTTVVADKQKAVSKYSAGAAMSTAAMGASMALMMTDSGKIGHNIGQWLLLSTFLVPAIKAANTGVIAMFTKMKALGAASRFSAAGARAFGKAMLASVGPVGWIVAGLTTVGIVAYKIWQHNKKVTAEQNKQSDILSKQNKTLDSQLKIRTRLSKLKPPSSGTTLPEGTSPADLADIMSTSATGKDLIKTYKDSSEIERQTLAAQVYMDTLNAVGGTADKARTKVEALMLAADEGALRAATSARELMYTLGPTTSAEELATLWGNQMKVALDETTEAAETTGKNLGERLGDAIASGGPEAATTFLSAMQTQIEQQYVDIFSALPKESADYFRGLGINSAEVFDQAIADYPGTGAGQEALQKFADKYKINVDQVENFMQQVYAARGALAGPLNNINNLEKGIANEISTQLRLAKSVNDLKAIQESWEFKLLSVNKQNANLIYTQYLMQENLAGSILGLFGVKKGLNEQERLTAANQAAAAAGLKVVNNLALQEKILAEGAAGAFGDSVGNINKMSGALRVANGIMSGIVSMSKEQVRDMYKTASTAVQDDIANALQSGFDQRQQAASDDFQSRWDKRIAKNDRLADKETRHLENKFDRLHNVMDAKWERRKDAMTDYWDKRIEAVDKAIEAEQEADDIRQKIFEAERTRIQRLNDMANTNIDFNTALSSGNLDEAAKIRNDMNAKTVDWALSDAGQAGSDASAARIKGLEASKDELEKQRDLALDNLEKIEKAQQASLDKREQQEKRHLEKMQKARQADLERQQQNAQKALNARQAAEKMAFDNQISLFRSYIATDEADLKRWMTQVGLSYDDFGNEVKAKGETWSTWFQNSMSRHLREAGRQIASDSMWTAMGKAARKDMLHSMGFKSLKEFGKFIQTGVLPKDFGSRDLNTKPATSTFNPTMNKPRPEVMHSGGVVGTGINDRTGVARTNALHPSEQMILAQKEEFLVNKRQSLAYRPLLEAINAGKVPMDSVRNVGDGTGGDLGVQTQGLAMGVMAHLFVRSIANAMQQKNNEAKAGSGGFLGNLLSNILPTGFIGGGGRGGWHVASVPGKGWVNSHDYRNGLGSPLYAAADGTIIESRAITSGGSPGNGLYGNKYRSFGETIVLKTKDGTKIRYAHLNPGARVGIGPVRGGDLIGRSGMTGNATGPHTHFEINGQEIAREWFKAHGIGLDGGGYTTSDGMANLHKDEVVISPEKTKALYDGIDKFSSMMDSASNIGFGTGGGTGSSYDWASRIFGVGSQTEFTPNTNVNVNKPPPPKSSSADSGKAMTLKTGTFNLFNHLSAKAQISDLKKLIRRSDILSLSEYNHPLKVGRFLKKQGWDIWDGHKGDTALAWNTKAITGLGFHTVPLNPKHHGPAGLMRRYAEYGLFRDRKSGRQFYQASLHTVPARNASHNVGTVKQRNAIQKEQAGNIQKLYNKLRRTGKPVIMGGDINRFIAAMLKHDIHGGGNNTFQLFGNFDSASSTTDKTGWRSDHPAVFANYKIPGLKTGGYTMSDGLANLHENELVIDPARTKILLEGIDNLASGSNATYNINMNVNGETNADEIVNKTISAIQRLEARKPQSRRG